MGLSQNGFALLLNEFRYIPGNSTLNIFERALLLCGLKVLLHKFSLMLYGLHRLQRVRKAIPVMRMHLQERSKAFQEMNKASSFDLKRLHAG
jgi:hypothetical protein